MGWMIGARGRANKEDTVRRPPTWKKGPMRLFQAGQRRGRTTSTGLFIPIIRDSSWRGSSTSASTSRSGERRSWRKRWSFQRDRYRLRRRMSLLKLLGCASACRESFCVFTFITKDHVNTKNRLLSAQLRHTASSNQRERRDEGQNVFCFFFPTGFATSLQLVLCPLVLPPLSVLSLLCA